MSRVATGIGVAADVLSSAVVLATVLRRGAERHPDDAAIAAQLRTSRK